MSCMFTLRTVLVCGTIAFAATGAASAQSTWYVDDDAPNDPGPGDPLVSDPLEDGSPDHPFDAIQKGITAAVNGDTVLVADGTYTGAGNKDLDFGGRLITVRSANGPETCIIDCEGNGGAFWFHSGETPAAVVDGFTMTGAWLVSGGAMAIWSCATVTNCVFSGNFSVIAGGGVCVSTTSDSTTLFAHCTFIDNSASLGAGLFLEMGSVALVDCVFRGNSATRGGGLCVRGKATISQCEFVQNSASKYGGAVCIEQPGKLPSVTNCAFVENFAGRYGGGIAAWDISGGGMVYVEVYNSTFADNEAAGGRSLAANTAYVDFFVYNCILWEVDAVYCAEGAAAHCYFSDVPGWGGQSGNIDADPLYVDPSAGNYRLRPGSPCIDAARNGYVPADEYDLDGDGDTDEPLPFDLDGRPRFVDDPDAPDTGDGTAPIVDMGAYEFQVPAFKRGDVNCDGAVDFNDIDPFVVALISRDEYESQYPDCDYALADVNADGSVDFDDIDPFVECLVNGGCP